MIFPNNYILVTLCDKNESSHVFYNVKIFFLYFSGLVLRDGVKDIILFTTEFSTN